MSRLDRLRALYRNDPPASPPSMSAVAAVTSLYRHWRYAGRELELLAHGLTHRRFHAALRALERACALVRIADELVEVIERASYDRDGGLDTADKLRRDLLAEILPWLEAARRELPAAATVLCSAAADATPREAALAALRQLVRVPEPSKQKTGT